MKSNLTPLTRRSIGTQKSTTQIEKSIVKVSIPGVRHVSEILVSALEQLARGQRRPERPSLAKGKNELY